MKDPWMTSLICACGANVGQREATVLHGQSAKGPNRMDQGLN